MRRVQPLTFYDIPIPCRLAPCRNDRCREIRHCAVPTHPDLEREWAAFRFRRDINDAFMKDDTRGEFACQVLCTLQYFRSESDSIDTPSGLPVGKCPEFKPPAARTSSRSSADTDSCQLQMGHAMETVQRRNHGSLDTTGGRFAAITVRTDREGLVDGAERGCRDSTMRSESLAQNLFATPEADCTVHEEAGCQIHDQQRSRAA